MVCMSAPISIPIVWDELDDLKNGDITLANCWDRLATHGDLFAGVLSGDQDLTAAEDALQIP